MKKVVKFISQNKLQFFFFLGVIGIMVFTIAISFNTSNNNVDEPTNDPVTPTPPSTDQDVEVDPVEIIQLPLSSDSDYVIVRKFYEKDGTKEDQKLSLIKYQNSYRTSTGTSYALKDGNTFDVLSVLSGKVVEIKESPLYNNYVVIEHDDDFKTYYYGLSEVTVTLGSEVNQGDKIGTSGKTEIDAETGNHVYVKMMKNGQHYNPEKLIGKKVSEIK